MNPAPIQLPQLPPHERSWQYGQLPRFIAVPADEGTLSSSWDFSHAIRRVSKDIVSRCSTLAHVQVAECLFTGASTRNTHSHGMIARLTPLRFSNGAATRTIRQREYRIQRYCVDDVEMKYIVTFSLPRFLNLPFEQKLITIFHELYHISPQFDGDFRRHPGRYTMHSHSRAEYDRVMQRLVQVYLQEHDTPEVFAFLHLTSAQLAWKYGCISSIRVPKPLIVPSLPAA